MKKTLGTVLTITILAVLAFGSVGSAYAMENTGKGSGHGGGGKSGDGVTVSQNATGTSQTGINAGTCDGTSDCVSDPLYTGTTGINAGTCDGTSDCVSDPSYTGTGGTHHSGGRHR